MLTTRKLNNRHAALLALAAIVGGPAFAQSVRLIVDPIDENRRVVLAGNTRGEASRPEFDRGRVDDAFPLNGMQLLLRRSPEREQAAEALADDLDRAGSATSTNGSPLLSMRNSSAPRRRTLPGSATGCGGMGSRCMHPAPAA